MASVKLVLKAKANKDGKFPIAIRIIKSRKASFIHLGHYVAREDWDEAAQRVRGSHPSAKRLNNFLLKKLTEATDKSLEVESQREDVSVKAIRQKIKPSAGVTFVPQAEAYLAILKQAGKYNRVVAERVHLNRLLKFIGHDVAFSDITTGMLERFQAWMSATGTIGERSASNSLAFIRDVYSRAMQAELVDSKLYPFGKGKTVIKVPSAVKVGLSADEVKKMELHTFENEKHQHAVNLWLFSYYNAGMRVSDVLRLRWQDIQDGRLHYVMGKNNKAGSVKLHEKALFILEQYEAGRTKDTDHVFPELRGLEGAKKYEVQRKISHKVTKLDERLAFVIGPMLGIKKRLSMHLARHSFAQVAGDKINIRVLQSLYRHSSVKTTIGYQGNFITKGADDALDAVLGV
ncbi:site-specific integrase [Hymenobacter sp. BT186]|uniref:Site-specific integrase n=1 Tax=Hymenobacter telluris TaxID=2816474 RepID=A0A939EWU3_9BACT|nr:site-specific integrase [Hymenobacter telluris]MBO0358654.1 site-specific integrase [Hymenobacter telluris]MBW3374680.1 site-specific integrase [Hymenobacter norwichensis]